MKLAPLRVAAACASLCGQAVKAQLVTPDPSVLPTLDLLTRPQTYAPVLNITTSGAFNQGLIFLAPYQHPGTGPYIYDKFGNLIWDGFGINGGANVHNFHICQYQGAPHLCFTQGNQQPGYMVGQAVVVDWNYRVVAQINTGRDATPADMHDFQLVDGKNPTALMTSYRTIPYDMTSFNITTGQGWLLEGMFQEVDVQSGEVLFEWYSTNHVDPHDTVIEPNTTDVGGDGLTPHTGFDYFHINSLEKNTVDGNYLVSARHTSTVYYINATDQSIIWRLSSEGRTDIKPQNFNFSFQHDARIQGQKGNILNISIFDNAHNCYASTSNQSSGRYITIDLDAKTATETRRVTGPQGGILSCSQGNTQLLENGHVFSGWGDKAWFSEHDADNNLVLAGTFTATPATDSTAMSYRIFTYSWQSTPSNTKPAVYSYALNSTSPNAIYVSWNGATTVANWRFYGADKVGDDFKPLGNTTKTGFETRWIAPSFQRWVMVEGLGPNGDSLGNSSYQPTFVPSQGLMEYCNGVECGTATSYGSS